MGINIMRPPPITDGVIKELTDAEKTNKEPEIIPGNVNGKVMYQKVRHEALPRLADADSKFGSSRDIDAINGKIISGIWI